MIYHWQIARMIRLTSDIKEKGKFAIRPYKCGSEWLMNPSEESLEILTLDQPLTKPDTSCTCSRIGASAASSTCWIPWTHICDGLVVDLLYVYIYIYIHQLCQSNQWRNWTWWQFQAANCVQWKYVKRCKSELPRLPRQRFWRGQDPYTDHRRSWPWRVPLPRRSHKYYGQLLSHPMEKNEICKYFATLRSAGLSKHGVLYRYTPRFRLKVWKWQ